MTVMLRLLPHNMSSVEALGWGYPMPVRCLLTAAAPSVLPLRETSPSAAIISCKPRFGSIRSPASVHPRKQLNSSAPRPAEPISGIARQLNLGGRNDISNFLHRHL